MGIFSSLFELKAGSNPKNDIYATIAQAKSTSPRYTDVKYTAIATEGYKRNWMIFRCVYEIMNAATQLEWQVMKYNKKGAPEAIPGHPVQLLLEQPYPRGSKSEFIKRAIAYYYIGGEAPLVKIMAGGRPAQINTYRPDRVKFQATGDMEQPYKNIIYNASREQPILPENFTLWKNFDPVDDLDGGGHGMSMLEPVLKNGDLLNLFLEWNNSLLANGGNLSGIIAMDPDVVLTDKQFERAEAQLNNKHGGAKKVGKFMLLEGGLKFQSTSNNPKDMDWSTGKKDTSLDICIGLGVDPLVIGINDKSSYNNKKEAMKALYTNTVIPRMLELCDCLGPFLGLQEGEYLTIDSSKVPALQEDLKELNESINNAKDLTINEKRAKRGVEPIEGGDIIAPEGSYAIVDGKVYLPMNLISIEDETSKQPLNNSQTQEENKSLENFLY